jgi:hypothetical protein
LRHGYLDGETRRQAEAIIAGVNTLIEWLPR